MGPYRTMEKITKKRDWRIDRSSLLGSILFILFIPLTLFVYIATTDRKTRNNILASGLFIVPGYFTFWINTDREAHIVVTVISAGIGILVWVSILCAERKNELFPFLKWEDEVEEFKE